MRADGLSTALMVLGPEQGLALAERNAIAAFSSSVKDRVSQQLAPRLSMSCSVRGRAMTWLLVFLVMVLVVAGMAIGVIMGRKPIAEVVRWYRQSGHRRNVRSAVEAAKCEEVNEAKRSATTDLAYDATKR